MRALRLHGPKDLQMHDEPIPKPKADEALVRIASVGVCASDVHWWRDGKIGSTELSDPLILGHEASGVVEAVGANVTNVVPGQKVALEPSRPCLECEVCAAGNFNVCPYVKFFGTPPTDGCFREYVTWPASLLLPVPDRMSLNEAAMIEPLAVGVFAAELSRVEPRESVVIFGAGAIGLSVLQSVKVLGAGKVLVIDPVASRLELAAKLGADAICDPSDAQSATDELTSGKGFDIVFECAGEITAVRATARLARILGRVMIVGIPREDEYPFDAGSARRKQLSAIFVRRSNLTAERAIELVDSGRIDAASYATHVVPLEHAEEALRLAESKADGVLRAVIRV